MLLDYTDPKLRRVMDEARAQRSREVARLFGLLFRRGDR